MRNLAFALFMAFDVVLIVVVVWAFVTFMLPVILLAEALK